MGTFRLLTRSELRIRKKLNQEDLVLFDQFKAYLSRMNGKDAGVYEFSEDEDHLRCKKLLRRAAKALDIPVRVIDQENSLVFYRKTRRAKKEG